MVLRSYVMVFFDMRLHIGIDWESLTSTWKALVSEQILNCMVIELTLVTKWKVARCVHGTLQLDCELLYLDETC